MPILQFTPLPSQPSQAFFSTLNSLKLDKLKLDESVQPITGVLSEGQWIRDRMNPEGQGQWVGGSLGVDERSFEGNGCVRYMIINKRTRVVIVVSCGGTNRYSTFSGVTLTGSFKNFNTIEDFRKLEPKKELFNQVVEEVSGSFIFHSRLRNPID